MSVRPISPPSASMRGWGLSDTAGSARVWRSNAMVTGRIDRGAYTVEKLIYQSLPEFYVTSSLYVPKEREARAPSVLFVCGHSESGKAYPRYQAVCADLAANGFVVLAMDPPGQG